jgi:hypothetical protein
MMALKQFCEMDAEGWPIGQVDSAKKMIPGYTWVDAGYLPEVVHEFCRQSGRGYHPTIGRGATQPRRHMVSRSATGKSLVLHVGEGFTVSWVPSERVFRMEVDADHWKTWLQQRLRTPLGQAGAMTLYKAIPSEHMSLARHLTAERKVEAYIAGKSVVIQWERMRKQNHWLDALYLGCAAGHLAGARLVGEVEKAQQRANASQRADSNRSSCSNYHLERWGDMADRVMSRLFE